MGNAQSEINLKGGPVGYHVLKVQDDSPGSKAGLEPFFDFITSINGQRLLEDDETFKGTLKNNVDRPVELELYNTKSQNIRKVILIPSTSWGGQGLLGVSIRFCSFEGAEQNVWHVLEVHPGSPAAAAQFRAYSDYIIGADVLLKESEDLFAVIESHEGKPLKLFVYNTDTDTVRDVTIIPNRNWGGGGSVGCDIGFGYLHRIPHQAKDETGGGEAVKSNQHNVGKASTCGHDHAHPHDHSHHHGHHDHNHDHHDHSHHDHGHDHHDHGHSHAHGACGGHDHDHHAPAKQDLSGVTRGINGSVTEHVHSSSCSHGHGPHSHDHGDSHAHHHHEPAESASLLHNFANPAAVPTNTLVREAPMTAPAPISPVPEPAKVQQTTAAPLIDLNPSPQIPAGSFSIGKPMFPPTQSSYATSYTTPNYSFAPPPVTPPQMNSMPGQFPPPIRPNIASFPVSVSGFPPITVTSTIPDQSALTNNVLSAFQLPPTTSTPPNLIPFSYQPAQNVATSATPVRSGYGNPDLTRTNVPSDQHGYSA
ncbi:uncharacterized protein LOC129594380 [Paramacrobiotus metropolitanus]|uniref:uncharacterized protein LOC129594380 n=1 Tax=Paramacrobiotus metropolitanus TaxID=2943436 RepID=UPI00244635E4|nr:uncharacterized protein LOC129594380 [Paramacrobiotus metropolitanus]